MPVQVLLTIPVQEPLKLRPPSALRVRLPGGPVARLRDAVARRILLDQTQPGERPVMPTLAIDAVDLHRRGTQRPTDRRSVQPTARGVSHRRAELRGRKAAAVSRNSYQSGRFAIDIRDDIATILIRAPLPVQRSSTMPVQVSLAIPVQELLTFRP